MFGDLSPFTLLSETLAKELTVTLGDNIEACKYKASAFLRFF